MRWPDEPVPEQLAPRFPALIIEVTTPRDQAALHRTLARQGYTAALASEEGGPTETYLFVHPDGQQP